MVCRAACVSLTSRIALTVLGHSPPITHRSLRLAARRDYSHLGLVRRGPMQRWSLALRPARPENGDSPGFPDPPRETLAPRLAPRTTPIQARALGGAEKLLRIVRLLSLPQAPQARQDLALGVEPRVGLVVRAFQTRFKERFDFVVIPASQRAQPDVLV